MEEFKPIQNHEQYLISNLGRVMNVKSKKFIKTYLDGPYVRVKLYKDNKYANKTLHTLVASHFIENDFNYEFVKHIDKDVLNNSYTNLIYVEAHKNNILQTHKICTLCKENLQIGDFVRSGKGYTSYCKPCDKIRKKKYDLNQYTLNQEAHNKTITGRAQLLRNRAKQRATRDNMDYDLDTECILSVLEQGKCQKTNIPFIIGDSDMNPYAPSIDRIDNTKGYVKNNIQIVCMIYNFCKNQFSDNDVFDFINKTIELKETESIFIPFNTPSSKNSRNFNLKLKKSFPSKVTGKYIRATKSFYTDYKDLFLTMAQGKVKPLKVKFTFVRDSKRSFDLINAAQIVQDLMVTHGWLTDDDYKNLIPSFGTTSVDKESAGVHIQIE